MKNEARGKVQAKAIFLDRDGVLNELVYDEEEGHVASPLSAKQLRVFRYAGESVSKIRQDLGYKAVVISNQPGVAKRQFSTMELEKMNQKIRKELARYGTFLDAEYYCLHHPNALIQEYRVICDCRKPKPGMLLRAAREHDIDLSNSFFVGDALIDVKAGKSAGCKTIMIGHMTSFLSDLMEKENTTPDYIVASLKEVPDLLISLTNSKTNRNRTTT